MKFENGKKYEFHTGRNILTTEQFYECLNKHDIKIKRVDNENEEFIFDEPLNIKDVKKLFDLAIDTDCLNPIYIDEKLVLEIKNKNFVNLLTETKSLYNDFSNKLETIKFKLIENSHLQLPETMEIENDLLRDTVNTIQKTIIEKQNLNTISESVDLFSDYKNKLSQIKDMSSKMIDIVNGDSLFSDKDLFDKLEIEDKNEYISQKINLIETLKDSEETIGKLLDNFSTFISTIEKIKDYSNMFENNQDSSPQI